MMPTIIRTASIPSTIPTTTSDSCVLVAASISTVVGVSSGPPFCILLVLPSLHYEKSNRQIALPVHACSKNQIAKNVYLLGSKYGLNQSNSTEGVLKNDNFNRRGKNSAVNFSLGPQLTTSGRFFRRFLGRTFCGIGV